MRTSRAQGSLIAVLSDTHGYLDPAIPALFEGAAHIIHAGDILAPEIVEELSKVAPVTAVAGNLDRGELAETLPKEVVAEAGGVVFAVGHKRKRLLKRLAEGRVEGMGDGGPPRLVVYGHEHVPAVAWVDGALHLNPGTASAPEEEDEVATVAFVDVLPSGLSVTFVPLAARQHR